MDEPPSVDADGIRSMSLADVKATVAGVSE